MQITFQFIIAVILIFIAISFVDFKKTLFNFIIKSKQPYLRFDFHWSKDPEYDEPKFYVELKNTGLGPAIIKNFKYKNLHENNTSNTILKPKYDSELIKMYTTEYGVNELMSPGEVGMLFHITLKEDSENAKAELLRIVEEISGTFLVIDYKNMFDDDTVFVNEYDFRGILEFVKFNGD